MRLMSKISREEPKRTAAAIESFVQGEFDSPSLGVDSEGRFCIPVDLRGEELYAPFAGKSRLNDDLFAAVEEAAKLSHKPIHLEMKLEEERLPEKDHVRRGYCRHYEAEMEETKRKIKKLNLQSLLLLAVGILFLAGYGLSQYYLGGHEIYFIVPEILSIVAWVFVWAATEKFFFDSRTERLHWLNYRRLKNASMTFYVERK